MEIKYKGREYDIDYSIDYDSYTYKDAEGDLAESRLTRNFEVAILTDTHICINCISDLTEDIELALESFVEKSGEEFKTFLSYIVVSILDRLKSDQGFDDYDGVITVSFKGIERVFIFP